MYTYNTTYTHEGGGGGKMRERERLYEAGEMRDKTNIYIILPVPPPTVARMPTIIIHSTKVCIVHVQHMSHNIT